MQEVLNLKKEQFNLRFQRATGQLENTARVRVVRRDIARAEDARRPEARRARSRNQICRSEYSSGIVVSDKQEKTVVVKVERRFHASAFEEDGAAHEELSRARRGQVLQGRRHRLDRGDAADLALEALGGRRSCRRRRQGSSAAARRRADEPSRTRFNSSRGINTPPGVVRNRRTGRKPI